MRCAYACVAHVARAVRVHIGGCEYLHYELAAEVAVDARTGKHNLVPVERLPKKTAPARENSAREHARVSDRHEVEDAHPLVVECGQYDAVHDGHWRDHLAPACTNRGNDHTHARVHA